MAREAQPAKVAFVSHHFRKNDGQGRVNYEVVKASLEDGYQVVVLGTSCADDLTFIKIVLSCRSATTLFLRNC